MFAYAHLTEACFHTYLSVVPPKLLALQQFGIINHIVNKSVLEVSKCQEFRKNK